MFDLYNKKKMQNKGNDTIFIQPILNNNCKTDELLPRLLVEKNIKQILKQQNEIVKDCEFIEAKDLLITRNMVDGSHYQPKQYVNSFSHLKNVILIVDFHNGGGGTTFFINTIVSHYKKDIHFLIVRNIEGKVEWTLNEDIRLIERHNEEESITFLKSIQKKIKNIFVNHLLFHTPAFVESLFELGKHITLITHDYSSLFEKYDPYYEEILMHKWKPSTIDINRYDLVITQSDTNKNLFSHFIKQENKNLLQINVAPLPDFRKSDKMITTNNDNIVVGIIGHIIEKKGSTLLESIVSMYDKNPDIQIVIFGKTDNAYLNNKGIIYPYNNIDEFNNLLLLKKPNVLLELSLWPETYSYTLTLAMLTQLPIVSYIKNFPSTISERLKTYKKKHFLYEIEDFISIVTTCKQNWFFTIKPVLYYLPFWKTLVKDRAKYDIQPFCVYFPQFHSIKENDEAYYKSFSDVRNAYLLSKYDKEIAIELPCTKHLTIDHALDYDLTNKNIIQTQVNLLHKYKLSGFAMYYYWFSVNSVTNEHMIMKGVIDSFFDTSIDMKGRKIFFIWANEDWRKNVAFGDSILNIVNHYNTEEFKKHIQKVMVYFHHKNYLKIDNKPVFFIHHPQMFTYNMLQSFYNILNEECIKQKFDGVECSINSTSDNYTGFQYYDFHPNYKNHSPYKANNIINNTNVATLNYKEYVENAVITKNIQTLFYDFDNRARLFLPNFLTKSTICIENDADSQRKYTEKVVESYKDKKGNLEKILLINAWNEWGEKMTIEPSDKKGTYYLDLLYSVLYD